MFDDFFSKAVDLKVKDFVDTFEDVRTAWASVTRAPLGADDDVEDEGVGMGEQRCSTAVRMTSWFLLSLVTRC